jgi:hypothetical protein
MVRPKGDVCNFRVLKHPLGVRSAAAGSEAMLERAANFTCDLISEVGEDAVAGFPSHEAAHMDYPQQAALARVGPTRDIAGCRPHFEAEVILSRRIEEAMAS